MSPLETFTTKLLNQMQSIVQATGAEHQDEMKYHLKATSHVRSILTDLNRFILTHTFQNVAEEVLFFRHIKPQFIKRYLFHQKLLELKLSEPFLDPEKISYHQTFLTDLQIFRNQNNTFYKYCLSTDTHFDEQYFTRQSCFPNLEIDKRVSTGFDSLYATLLANDDIRDFILKLNSQKIATANSELTWTAPKASLIELVYALKATAVFNEGKADLKQIITTFENLFQIKLGNYSRVCQDIRLRKSGQTNFLDLLKDKFLARLSEID